MQETGQASPAAQFKMSVDEVFATRRGQLVAAGRSNLVEKLDETLLILENAAGLPKGCYKIAPLVEHCDYKEWSLVLENLAHSDKTAYENALNFINNQYVFSSETVSIIYTLINDNGCTQVLVADFTIHPVRKDGNRSGPANNFVSDRIARTHTPTNGVFKCIFSAEDRARLYRNPHGSNLLITAARGLGKTKSSIINLIHLDSEAKFVQLPDLTVYHSQVLQADRVHPVTNLASTSKRLTPALIVSCVSVASVAGTVRKRSRAFPLGQTDGLVDPALVSGRRQTLSAGGAHVPAGSTATYKLSRTLWADDARCAALPTSVPKLLCGVLVNHVQVVAVSASSSKRSRRMFSDGTCTEADHKSAPTRKRSFVALSCGHDIIELV